MNNNYKKCKNCLVNKPIEMYHKSPKSKGGYNTICKNCVSVKRKRIKLDKKANTFISKKELTKKEAIRIAKMYNINHIRQLNNKNKHGSIVGLWKCLDCDYIYKRTYSEQKRKKSRCNRCSHKYRSVATRLKTISSKHNNIIQIIKDTNVFDNVSPAHRKYLVKCNICYCQCTALLKDLEYCDSNELTGHSAIKCDCNKNSTGETYIKKILDEFNIEYTREFKPKWCINPKTNGRMRYDFLINSNILLEFDGEPHYYTNNNKTKLYYDPELQYRDSLKRHLAIEHGFSHYTIPFWEIDNLQDILLDILTHHNIL